MARLVGLAQLTSPVHLNVPLILLRAKYTFHRILSATDLNFQNGYTPEWRRMINE